MKHKILFFTIVAISMMSLPANAQEPVQTYTQETEKGEYLRDYYLKDNFFYSIKIGADYTWNSNLDDCSTLRRLRPAAAFSLGKWFSPVVGLRGMATLSKNRGGISETDRGYTWHSFDLGVDGLLSLTNLFIKYKENRFFNFLVFAGVGGIQTFEFSRPDWNADHQYFNPEGCTLLQYRVGAITHFRISELLDLSLELNHNMIHDSFDGQVTNHRWDRRTTLFLGIIRRFRNNDDYHEFRYATFDKSKFDESIEKINDLHRQELEAANRPNPVRDVDSKQTIVLVSFPPGSTSVNEMQEVNVYTIAQVWKEIGKDGKVYITPLGQTTSEQLFYDRVSVLKKTLTEQYGLPAENIVTELDARKVESSNKASDKIIVYVNESKK